MPLNTDEDDEELSNVAPPKRRTPDKKRGVEGNGRKAESKHDRASVNSTSPKSEKQRNAKKYKNIESSDDDDETDKESGEEASEDSSEDSSSDSGLEEVEKKGADALGALFDAEVRTGARHLLSRTHAHHSSSLSLFILALIRPRHG